MWEALVVWVLASVQLGQMLVARGLIRAVCWITRTQVASEDTFCAVMVGTGSMLAHDLVLKGKGGWAAAHRSISYAIAEDRDFSRREKLPCTGNPDTCRRPGCDPCWNARHVEHVAAIMDNDEAVTSFGRAEPVVATPSRRR